MVTPPLSGVRQSEPVLLPTERQCPFDPPGELGELRDDQPLTRLRFPDGHIGWLVTSHELARAVLGDQRFSRVPSGAPSFPPDWQPALVFDAIQHDTTFPAAVRTLVDRYQGEGRLTDAIRDPEVVRTIHEHPLTKLPFSNMDPPRHDQLRRIHTGYFSVRRVGEHRPFIERIVADRLAAMAEAGPPVDLVATFARPIPSLVTCAMFGIPESDSGTFERLSAIKTKPDTTADDILEANEEFRAFARELIERKRAQPGDDLLSALIHGGEMTYDELVTNTVFLVASSHTTTINTIGYGVAALLQNRDQWDMLRAESTDIGRVVEELLRYTTAIHVADIRTALEDVELGGTVIKAFEPIAISLAAANRDPQVFAEPDRLDIARQASKHLAFSYGIHQCLGQHLVRLELQIALPALARRFPSLDLAVPVEDIPWHRGDRGIYGPERLPVTW